MKPPRRVLQRANRSPRTKRSSNFQRVDTAKSTASTRTAQPKKTSHRRKTELTKSQKYQANTRLHQNTTPPHPHTLGLTHLLKPKKNFVMRHE
ncbi:unnamed protein product [Trichogramma brassicae]|uniref:Uncharacterized protein n=1 Tax=Trichogramma brassicae TaxID=86971 RepID=A0A6H5I377_9HYME|nr:unnamed protein product [Trichogramma brassicae]